MNDIIIISEDIIEENGFTIDEYLLLLSLGNDMFIEQTKRTLAAKELIKIDNNNNFGCLLTQKGRDTLLELIFKCDDSIKQHANSENEKLKDLADKLKNIFPKGKKSGTNCYWAEGQALIVRRLKLFFKKYGNEYTPEQIIEAAERYIKSFNGDYRYMKILKYFILKEKVGAGGDIEGESELINYIENSDQEDINNNDWTNTLK